MSWSKLEQRLFARARAGMKLGLDRMERALTELGRPDRCAPSIHVAGTNGKGSVCAFAESMLRASGLRTGLYTSPHLERFGERLRVDGREISDDELVALHERLEARLAWAFEGPDELTFFELVTLLAFQHFADAGVEVIVAETGLGGRLDATNVLSPRACAITSIGHDHQEFLGESLPEIAREKAGIIKPSTPLVLSQQPAEALEAIASVARSRQAPFELEGTDFVLSTSSEVFTYESRSGTRHVPKLGLAGPHQRANAAVAVRLIECAGFHLSDESVREGLASARWPGRFERVRTQPDVILDGAHNPEGARALAAAIEAELPGRSVRLLVGVLGDKQAAAMMETLAPRVTEIMTTAPESPRALPAEALARQARLHHEKVEVASGPREGLERLLARSSKNDVVVVCGSLYLVGEVRALLAGGRAGGPRESLVRGA